MSEVQCVKHACIAVASFCKACILVYHQNLRVIALLNLFFSQEAQAALLAKDDELAMLWRDMHLLRAQAKQPQASPPQPSSAQPSAAHASHAQDSAAEAQPQASSSRPAEPRRPKQADSALGVGESGLPSPSLPATPLSPGGSPRGTFQNPAAKHHALPFMHACIHPSQHMPLVFH